MNTAKLALNFCGIKLSHPLINGSGTFDAIAARTVFGDKLLEQFPFAAYVSKTITPAPRQGNPPPRIWEVPGGMINSIGLQNRGLDGYIKSELPRYRELPVPLITSVMAPTADEVGAMITALECEEGIAAFEVDVSCPHVKTGLSLGTDPAITEQLVASIRPLTEKPLLIKLTPNATDVPSIALAAERGGADAVTLINTIRGMAFHPTTGAPWLGGTAGGVSGPCIKATACAYTYAVAQSVTIPVVGMGGVQAVDDVENLLHAGATLVGIGTENFRNPAVATQIVSELVERQMGTDAVNYR